MLGVWLSRDRGELQVLPLRATLERQTGMYRITQTITDPKADALIGRFCEPKRGCLKKILWQIGPDAPITSLPPEKFPSSESPREWPLLCHEACNLLVAEAAKSRETMILRARLVVPIAADVIENGAVVVEGNPIVAVGPADEIQARWYGPTKDLGDVALMPGLINAHCHLDYTILRNAIHPPNSFHRMGPADQRAQTQPRLVRLSSRHSSRVRGSAKVGHDHRLQHRVVSRAHGANCPRRRSGPGGSTR